MMVYEYIRQQMREGSLLPGSVLDLPAISHKLGISNTPLRDSLIRLEAEGYLTIYPRSKVVINTLEAEDFPFLYEIMGALEYTIIAGSIDQYTEATIAKMRRLSGDMREAVMSGDMVTYDRSSISFSQCFFEVSNSCRAYPLAHQEPPVGFSSQKFCARMVSGRRGGTLPHHRRY